jgi:hypothetical protein
MKRTELLDQLSKVFRDLTAEVPASTERTSADPSVRTRSLTLKAASEAALVSGALSLPPGPLGVLTVLPDLIAVWKIQRQLVSDIAASYGKTQQLGTETMIYCLFRHAAAQAVRDLVVRAAERLFVRRATPGMLQRLLGRIGLVVSERVAGRTVSRWLPIAGAIGIGAYAFYDTVQVGKTAQKLFHADLEVETISSTPDVVVTSTPAETANPT